MGGYINRQITENQQKPEAKIASGSIINKDKLARPKPPD
jgi:hypothetical protein